MYPDNAIVIKLVDETPLGGGSDNLRPNDLLDSAMEAMKDAAKAGRQAGFDFAPERQSVFGPGGRFSGFGPTVPPPPPIPPGAKESFNFAPEPLFRAVPILDEIDKRIVETLGKYRVDKFGLTTRTISGHIRIPMTRKSVGNRDLPDCVDAYRESIDPPRLVGFRRTPGSYQTNFDKTMLTFEVVDEEFPSYTTPPPGVMEWTASHTFTTSSAILTSYNATLEASYLVGKGLDKRIAVAHFWKLALDRLKGLKYLKTRPISGSSSQASPIIAIPTSFTVTEDIAGPQTAKFSLGYSLAGLEFTDLLLKAGLWTEPPDCTWSQWDASVGDAYLGPRGLAQLETRAEDDWIVDLCRDLDPLYPRGAPRRMTTRDLRPRLLALFPEITAPSSWLHWRCAVEVESDSGTAEMRSLPSTYLDFKSPGSDDGVQEDGIPGFEIGGVKAYPAGKLVNDPVPKAKQQVTVQRRAAPLVLAYLTGSALRVRYPIARPRLGKVDGKEPREVSRLDRGEVFRLEQVGQFGDPVWRAVWRLRFLLETVPENGLDSLLPQNPVLERESGF